MHKLYSIFAAALVALSAHAQVSQSELAGKYHLQGEAELWSSVFANKVTIHDDFTFQMTDAGDGTFQLSSFFYSGMDASWVPLPYSATATFSPSEQLLYVYSTEWMWDDWMDLFMDPQRDEAGAGKPMLYFLVGKDRSGHITLTTGKNSAGFYGLRNGQFEYAIDYPDVLSATKVDTYASVTPATLPGEYTMSYRDFYDREATTDFTIKKSGAGYVLTGMFGDKHEHPLFFDADGTGVYCEVEAGINEQSYYTYYFGSIVGECRVMFHFDEQGNLVSDNYITYTPDWRTWYDAFDAVATKNSTDGITTATTTTSAAARTYDLSGRQASQAAGIIVREGKKMIK